MTCFQYFVLICLSLLSLALPAADPPSESWTFTLRFENDMFNGTDRFYTDGIKLNWISPELDWFRDLSWFKNEGLAQDTVEGIISVLPFREDETRQRNFSVSIGQMMYTPGDTRTSELILDDRPYAGWLYGSLAFHSKNYRVLDTFEIQAGFTGKWSFAKQAQDLVHMLRSIDKANGWENQIKTEPGIMLVYDHKYRLVPHLKFSGRWGADAIINAGGAVGNISTNLNGGVEIRAGWRLPTDFGTALIRPGGDTNAPADTSDIRYVDDYKSFSAHLFMATIGRIVIRDIFLDGNSFTSSHSVEKEPFVADLVIGASIVYRKLKLSYAHVLRSKEFKSESGGHDFGSVTFSYTY
jgi:lipid A 3-O-deacylase